MHSVIDAFFRLEIKGVFNWLFARKNVIYSVYGVNV